MVKIIKNWTELLVKDRRLSPRERIASRLGYMGTGFIMLAPYILSAGTVGPVVYIICGFICIQQVWLAKQLNLVAVNIIVMIGFTIYLYNA